MASGKIFPKGSVDTIERAILTAAGIALPFVGTALGASAVFFIRKKPSDSTRKAFLGFACGVMLAASVWSLLIPAVEVHWAIAAAGFMAGVGAMVGLDASIPRLARSRGLAMGPEAMLVLAVTLHNLPEGMAVGVALAGAEVDGSLAEALLLSLGIAIQNLPEGAIISTPLTGRKKLRAFCLGTASGIVEPLGALLTLWLTAFLSPALPFVLAFAAGAMVYVVFEELAAEIHSGPHSFHGTIGMALGFTLMMVLDAALG